MDKTIVHAGPRTVGELRGDTYVTWRKRAEHFFRKGKGYAIGVALLHKLQAEGCTQVIIVEEREPGRTAKYLYTLQEYLDAPQFHERGFELQRCARLDSTHRFE